MAMKKGTRKKIKKALDKLKGTSIDYLNERKTPPL
jgi:hypothetical protein